MSSTVQGWCPRYVLTMLVIRCCPEAHYFPRCLAPANDLDNPTFQNNPRTLEHTQAILENLELGQIWDAYGLVGDIVVSDAPLSSKKYNMLIHQEQPFTEGFPQANVHELLSPDILHQLIKGVFKDHLVTWIEEWIFANHTKNKAREILDDIDRRYELYIGASKIRC